MTHASWTRTLVAGSALLLGLTATAGAQLFPSRAEFEKLMARQATFDGEGKPKRLCLCKQPGADFNAPGILDFRFVADGGNSRYKARCRVPAPRAAVGEIDIVSLCDTSFEILD